MLKTGFSRVTITPMLGISLFGYYIPRYADGILDDLEINTLALSAGDKQAVLLSIDHCGIRQTSMNALRAHVAEAVSLPIDSVYVSATHTHTAPFIDINSTDPLICEYTHTIYKKMAEGAKMALDDLHPSRLGWGIGIAPNIAFVRRYRMKDGSICTNPGINNPEIAEPLGVPDNEAGVLRFDRENAETIIVVNIGIHPDTIGGCKISADWPGAARRTVEKVLDNTKCIVFNGAQGDINHVKVNPSGGDLNDMFIDFDDVIRGYGHTLYMGRVIAGAVLQTYDKVAYIPVNDLRIMKKEICIPANLPTDDEIEEAQKITSLHQAGEDHLLPYKGMQLTTAVAKAARILRVSNGPASFSMSITGIAFGSVAFLGIPGEPFCSVGKAIKNAPGWNLIIPCINTNGKEGYFPTRDAYEEGGYETAASDFRKGVAEQIIEESLSLLESLRI